VFAKKSSSVKANGVKFGTVVGDSADVVGPIQSRLKSDIRSNAHIVSILASIIRPAYT
jgi:hypothetical protein